MHVFKTVHVCSLFIDFIGLLFKKKETNHILLVSMLRPPDRRSDDVAGVAVTLWKRLARLSWRTKEEAYAQQ